MEALEARFEDLVQQLIAHERAVAHDLFPDQILSALFDRLAELRIQDDLRPAAIGAAGRAEVHTEIRSDFIRWWSDQPEHPAEKAYLEIVQGLASYLNRTCYAGIRRFECMYATYPTGASYARHVDDFQHKNARKFSLVTYLNRAWTHDAGGELVTYGASGPEYILPTFGKTVIFSSPDMEHEVLVARRERWSITGWMR